MHNTDVNEVGKGGITCANTNDDQARYLDHMWIVYIESFGILIEPRAFTIYTCLGKCSVIKSSGYCIHHLYDMGTYMMYTVLVLDIHN